MTVRLDDEGCVMLEGECPAEDSVALHQHLLASPQPWVDWSGCRSAHTAVIQVLLACKPSVRGVPLDPFLESFIAPLLGARRHDV